MAGESRASGEATRDGERPEHRERWNWRAWHAPRAWRDWRADLVAGATVAGLLVPQGMAYAGIAGLRPEVGLYATVAGLLVYALVGSSRHLVVSPTSSSAALVAATVAPLAGGDPALVAAYASAVALVAGVLFLAAALAGLGSVSDFVAKPVLKGFVFGLGLTIAARQLPKLLGVEPGEGHFFAQVWHVASTLSRVNPAAVVVGLSALLVSFVLGARARRVPSALVVLVLGIATTRLLDLAGRFGVAIVGEVPEGLPRPMLPPIGRAHWLPLFWPASGVVLVLFAEALGAARSFAAKHGYEVDPNRELAALGASNLAAGLFQGLAVGGGASATAVDDAAGGRSERASLAAGAAVVATLLLFMPLFHDLPEAVLGAIVIHAVAQLLDVRELRRYARIGDGLVPAAAALLGVLSFGILRGLVLAALVTLGMLVRRISTPLGSVLGRLPDTAHYVDVEYHPEAHVIPGLLIYRFEVLLFYANADRFLQRLRALIREAAPPLEGLVCNLEVVSDLGVTALDMLDQLERECAARGIELRLARVRDPVRERLRRSGLLDRLGKERVFRGVDDAVRDFLARRQSP